MKKKRNWKTTMLGIGVLIMTGVQIANNPKRALDENTIQGVTQGLIGLGLIQAADAKKKEE